MVKFNSVILFVAFTVVSCIFSTDSLIAQSNKKIKTLIIDGQNNHGQWPKITFMMKDYLEETGLFKVDVRRTAFTWRGDDLIPRYKIKGAQKTQALKESKTDPDYKPKFSKYDLVVCNFGWKAAPWPKETQSALEEFVSAGGGLVIVHAADNSFPEWLEYNKMIGLGGWGDRSEKDGPYVYYNDEDELVRNMEKGKAGSHGPQSEYQVQIRNKEHPITKGMPEYWIHAKDELYAKLRGPAENMEILATAYSSEDNKGTGRHEPILMVLNYGQGRVFHTPMGHVDYSIACVGFIISLQRGSEWAATGEVSIGIPKDFPTADRSSSREYPRD